MKPRIWLSLQLDGFPIDEQVASRLAEAARAADSVIDISSQPGFWGGWLRGSDVPVMAVGDPHIERAPSASHAAMFVESEVIQFLSAIGRPKLDFCFLKVSPDTSMAQLHGMIQAMNELTANGHVDHFGVDVRPRDAGVLGDWLKIVPIGLALCRSGQLDQIPAALETVIEVAGDDDWPSREGSRVLVPVRSAEEIVALTSQGAGVG